MILLDTVVVSELRKTRPNPHVIAWMRSLHEADVFLSVVTIGEIERGIPGVRDSEFAADGLTVATRNVRHFAPAGVPVFDPFKAGVA